MLLSASIAWQSFDQTPGPGFVVVEAAGESVVCVDWHSCFCKALVGDLHIDARLPDFVVIKGGDKVVDEMEVVVGEWLKVQIPVGANGPSPVSKPQPSDIRAGLDVAGAPKAEQVEKTGVLVA